MGTLWDAVASVFPDHNSALIMNAIALAESGGNAWAYNPNSLTGDKSYGLFQINMIGNLGPAREKEYGLSSYDDLFDVQTNISVAYSLSNAGKDFTPWTTFTTGAYEAHLGNTTANIVYQSENGSPKTDGGSSRVGKSANPYPANTDTPGHWYDINHKSKIPDPPIKVTTADLPSTENGSSLGRFKLTQVQQMGDWLTKFLGGPAAAASIMGNSPQFFISNQNYQYVIYNYVNFVTSSQLSHGASPQGGDQGKASADKLPGESWLDTLGSILSWLSSADHWKRIGLFALGSIIIIVVATEFLKEQ